LLLACAAQIGRKIEYVADLDDTGLWDDGRILVVMSDAGVCSLFTFRKN